MKNNINAQRIEALRRFPTPELNASIRSRSGYGDWITNLSKSAYYGGTERDLKRALSEEGTIQSNEWAPELEVITFGEVRSILQGNDTGDSFTHLMFQYLMVWQMWGLYQDKRPQHLMDRIAVLDKDAFSYVSGWLKRLAEGAMPDHPLSFNPLGSAQPDFQPDRIKTWHNQLRNLGALLARASKRFTEDNSSFRINTNEPSLSLLSWQTKWATICLEAAAPNALTQNSIAAYIGPFIEAQEVARQYTRQQPTYELEVNGEVTTLRHDYIPISLKSRDRGHRRDFYAKPLTQEELDALGVSSDITQSAGAYDPAMSCYLTRCYAMLNQELDAVVKADIDANMGDHSKMERMCRSLINTLRNIIARHRSQCSYNVWLEINREIQRWNSSARVGRGDEDLYFMIADNTGDEMNTWRTIYPDDFVRRLTPKFGEIAMSVIMEIRLHALMHVGTTPGLLETGYPKRDQIPLHMPHRYFNPFLYDCPPTLADIQEDTLRYT